MFSFSQYNCFLNCPKKYYWSYIQRLVSCTPQKALEWGTEFHKGAAGLSDKTLPAKIGIRARKFFVDLPGQKNEVPISTTINGIPFQGIVDAMNDEFIIEYKTTSRANSNTCNAMELSIQTRLYAMITERPKVMLRMVKKSLLRQKMTETEEQFEERVLGEYITKPEEYFQQIELSNVQRLGTFREFAHVCNMIESCKKEDIWPMSSPYACYGNYACPYLELCSDPVGNRHLYREKENE